MFRSNLFVDKNITHVLEIVTDISKLHSKASSLSNCFNNCEGFRCFLYLHMITTMYVSGSITWQVHSINLGLFPSHRWYYQRSLLTLAWPLVWIIGTKTKPILGFFLNFRKNTNLKSLRAAEIHCYLVYGIFSISNFSYINQFTYWFSFWQIKYIKYFSHALWALSMSLT